MDFERKPSVSSSVSQVEVHRLLNFMYINSLNSTSRNSIDVVNISEKCRRLFEHDYQIEEINNIDGSLCPHYPPRIYIPVIEKHAMTLANAESGTGLGPVTMENLEELFRRAKNARVRGRFVAPVLLCNGRYLSRSGTISAWAETYGLHAYKTAQNYASRLLQGGRPRGASEGSLDESPACALDSSSADTSNGDIFDKHRGDDKQLLTAMNIKYIADLMVENKKYRSYIPFPLSSSEKIDRSERYRDFTVLTMPYPGCEFFRVWSFEENCAMQEVRFDWNTPGVNAALNVSAPAPRSAALINWAEYRSWDLSTLTEHYLRLLLGYLVEGSDGGVLVHCLSGWDRTPLFCSLLRLLLWADGLAHPSLNPLEMLYLTLAYDWFLFAHQLPDRLSKKEEILKFCFYFLNYVKDKRELSMLEYYSEDVSENSWQERSQRIECLWKSFSALRVKVEEQIVNLEAGKSNAATGLGNLFNSLASKMRSTSGSSLNQRN